MRPRRLKYCGWFLLLSGLLLVAVGLWLAIKPEPISAGSVQIINRAEPASQSLFPTHIIGINLAIIGSVMSFFGLFSLRQSVRFSANQPSNP